MNRNEKKILNYFKNLPAYNEFDDSKICQEISDATNLKIDDVIKNCHSLDLKGMLSKTTWKKEDNKDIPEKTGYSATSAGIRSLDRNWNQTTMNGIFIISAIVTTILALNEIFNR